MTLYILKSDNPERANHKRLVYSFRGLVEQVVVLEDRELYKIEETRNRWWGYMFDSEYIDQNTRLALPIFLAQKDYDYYNLYKKLSIVNGNNTEIKVYTSPRIFRDYVRIKEGPALIPLNEGTSTTILDGWILEDDWSQMP